MKEKESVTVKIGDHVKKGQVITKSGDVGFCPTSHLHIQFHLSDDPRAPTVSFAFAQLLDQENQNNDLFSLIYSQSSFIGQRNS